METYLLKHKTKPMTVKGRVSSICWLNCTRIILLYFGWVEEAYLLIHTNQLQTYDFVKGRVRSICWLNCTRIILLYYGRVRETYLLMHTNQTYEFVKERASIIC